MKKDLSLKKCNICSEVKGLSDFYKAKKGTDKYRIICKICDNKIRNINKRKRKAERYIYIITIDNNPVRVGSTVDLIRRMSEYRTTDKGFIHLCEKNGVEYKGKEIIVWLLDLTKQCENLTVNDLRYHEHKIIRYFKQMGKAVLNDISNRRLEERERYIDENEAFIVYEDFRKTDIRIV